MDENILYFAYGSNLHPERLRARIPSSRFICICPVAGYQLRFHKRGEDLSGKCNAVFTGIKEHFVLGAVFNMKQAEKALLDNIEGEGYCHEPVDVKLGKQFKEAFMYVAEEPFIDDSLNPFQWYKDFVQLGAQYHRFPDQYLQTITAIEAIDDHDEARHRSNESVLALMR
jgi:gamma-glutamylcyclotransferase (GGCT)/AIG2-like uncharacterized protein YtfP